MRVKCGDCSREWGGLSPAHCSGCHKTFATVNAFDRHQCMRRYGSVCADPSTVGLVYDKAKDLYRFMSTGEEKDSNDLRPVQRR